MRSFDYIQFLNNYEYYLSVDMVPDELDLSRHSSDIANDQAFMPRGIIADSVCWEFVHYKSAGEAVKQWNRRRHYINYDNIIALMIILTDKEAYEFEKVPISKKLGFYHKELNLKSVLYTPEWEREWIRNRYNWSYSRFIHRFYVRNIEKIGKVDWIRFLNGNDSFLRF